MKPNYGYWRTDKPKEAGFSHEFISSDTEAFIEKTGADPEQFLDSLDGLEHEGIDTLLKAFKRNVELIPDHKWLGTRSVVDASVKDKVKYGPYEWVTLK